MNKIYACSQCLFGRVNFVASRLNNKNPTNPLKMKKNTQRKGEMLMRNTHCFHQISSLNIYYVSSQHMIIMRWVPCQKYCISLKKKTTTDKQSKNAILCRTSGRTKEKF